MKSKWKRRLIVFGLALLATVWFLGPLVYDLPRSLAILHLITDIFAPVGVMLGYVLYRLFFEEPTERVFKVRDGEVIDCVDIYESSWEDAEHHDSGPVPKEDDNDGRVWVVYDWDLSEGPEDPMQFWGTWEGSVDPDGLMGAKTREDVKEYHGRLERLAKLGPMVLARASTWTRDAFYDGVYTQGSDVNDLLEDGAPDMFAEVDEEATRLRAKVRQYRADEGDGLEGAEGEHSKDLLEAVATQDHERVLDLMSNGGGSSDGGGSNE